MKLFIEGHAVRKGYAISLCYSDKEISAMEYTDEVDKPLRFIQSRDKAFELVERWNRRFSNEYKQS
jgi:hypothetical protein